jgi:hypothetical protein
MKKFVAIFIWLLFAIACQARIITVDDDGPADFNNIQAAINDSDDGDTIVVADGTYTGAGNWDIDFKGKEITVRSENGPQATVVDCGGGQARGFYFHSGETSSSVLSGFTIREGGLPAHNMGGCICCDESSPIIVECMLVLNFGGVGALSCHNGAAPTLFNCTIAKNAGEGGVIGCYSSSSPKLINCTINENVDGALQCHGAYPTFLNCVFLGNSGGEVLSVKVGSYITRTNCLISGNSGSGVSICVSCFVDITSCTITDNRGAGIDIYTGSPDPSCFVNLSNSIVWGNAGGSLINVDSEVSFCCIGTEEVFPGVGNTNLNPMFICPGIFDFEKFAVEAVPDFWDDWMQFPDFAINSGDYHLQADSPCINAGDPYYAAEPDETDLDGKPRVIGGRIDMGAYEYRPPIQAEMRIIPRSISLKSKGQWIAALLRLPEEYNVADIDPNSILLENEIKPDSFRIIKDEQIAIAKFSREDVQSILDIGEVELTITGQLTDGTVFEAEDTIKVTDKGGGNPVKQHQSAR